MLRAGYSYDRLISPAGTRINFAGGGGTAALGWIGGDEGGFELSLEGRATIAIANVGARLEFRRSRAGEWQGGITASFAYTFNGFGMPENFCRRDPEDEEECPEGSIGELEVVNEPWFVLVRPFGYHLPFSGDGSGRDGWWTAGFSGGFNPLLVGRD